MAIKTVPVYGAASGSAYYDIAATTSTTASSSTTTITLPTVKLKVPGQDKAYYFQTSAVVKFGSLNLLSCRTAKSTSTAIGAYTNALSWTMWPLYDSNYTQTTTIPTSAIFTSNNQNSKTATLTLLAHESAIIEGSRIDGSNCYYYVSSDTTLMTITVTLNVPPTFLATDLKVNHIAGASDNIYAGYNSVYTTISDATAYYGGEIVSTKLTIGNDTVTGTGNGDLGLIPTTPGTFTPIVTVTDSRGQTTTKQLSEITILPYSAPSVSFTPERTNNDGTFNDETSTSVTLPITFTFIKDLGTMSAPVIKVDEVIQDSVSWYSNRNTSTGALSDSVIWQQVNSGDTRYAVIDGIDSDSHTISVTPAAGTTTTVMLPGQFFTIDFLAGGRGIAFGQSATIEGFTCSMDIYTIPLIGSIQMFAGSIAPNGWLICDGRAISRTTYVALFTVIGTTYGEGDGSTTFNLPNFCGRVPIGVGISNATGATMHVLGQQAGSEDAIVPSHTHTILAGGGTHTHTINAKYNTDQLASGTARVQYANDGENISTTMATIAANTGAHTHTIESTGSNAQGANMMPYLGINFIIHAGVPTR